jgi:hypothetical protein
MLKKARWKLKRQQNKDAAQIRLLESAGKQLRQHERDASFTSEKRGISFYRAAAEPDLQHHHTRKTCENGVEI